MPPPTANDVTNMPTTNRPINAGVSMDDNTSRLDGVAKVTGLAKYGRDMYLPNGLFVRFIRCPWGLAELESTNSDAAMKVKGVVEVFLEADKKRGQYNGDNLGYVVADSPAALARGLRALDCKWKMQTPKTKIEDDLGDVPETNSETADVIKGADHVLDAVYTTECQTHSSLETHGSSIDHKGDSAIVYASTQGTFSGKDQLEQALQLPASKFEVVCEYVGGGFGSKLNGPGKEGVTAGRVAAKYKRPVYLFCDRAEDHLDTGNRPSMRASAKIGFKKDGTIVGGRIHVWGGTGVARGGGDGSVPSGRYDFGKVQRTNTDVRFNAGAPRPFRAPGRPQGAFAEEMILDEIAAVAGVDPLELRLRLDRETERQEMMRLGAKLIGWSDRKANGSQSGVIRTGYGMGTTTWGRFPANVETEVVINRDGSVEARTGTQDIGTGQRTIMAVLAAETIGVPLNVVSCRIGSSSLPVGPGSGGSVTAHNTSPPMTEAAADAKKKFLEMVAQRAGAEVSEFDIANGEIIRNKSPFSSWKDACAKMSAESVIGRGSWNQAKLRDDPSTGHSHGVQFVKLRVDTETGVISVDHVIAIQSCGRIVCRKTAESQIIGGVIQGVSYALFENRLLDRNTGAMVNPNLEMYKILGTRDMPHIEPVLWGKNQTGVRSLGEPPTIPTSGAIACAVLNAIGKPVRSLPLTPDKVLAALAGGAA
jgi:xanthine dehydrogenase YagR molybdenum-binding subunit